MRAKLLGAVSAAALLGSVSVASAQGPMQLTDNQLDGVTAGGSATVIGNCNTGCSAGLTGTVFVNAANTTAFASITGNFLGNGRLSLAAFANVP